MTAPAELGQRADADARFYGVTDAALVRLDAAEGTVEINEGMSVEADLRQ